MSTLKLDYAPAPERRLPWWLWLVVGAVEAVVFWHLIPAVIAGIVLKILIYQVIPMSAIVAALGGVMWLVYPGRWSGVAEKRKRTRLMKSKRAYARPSSSDL